MVVAENYFRTWDDIRNNTPNDTSRIDAIAVGTARDAAVASISNAAKQGIKSSGYVKYTLLSGQSYAAPVTDAAGNLASQFGQPILVGCLSYDGLSATKSDGSTISPTTPKKVELIPRFNKADATWLIVSYKQLGDDAECAN